MRIKRSLCGTLRLRCDSCEVAPLTIRPIKGGRVCSDAIVPNHNCPRCPLDSDLEVLTQCDMVVQELQEIVAFFLFVPNDVASELRVHIQCFLAGDWMCSDNGVNRCHWLSSHYSTSKLAILCLLMSWMLVVRTRMELIGKSMARIVRAYLNAML